MIQLFRNMRQNLLGENRFSKYLFYAIGEIILVVIGILLALQLNILKSENKERKLEQIHLKNLAEDLEFQLELIESQMEHDSTLFAKADSAYSFFSGDISIQELEALLYGAYSLGYRRTFVESDVSYNELLNTGGLTLIKDMKLRKAIMRYYQQLHYTSKVINTNNGLIDQAFNLYATNNAVMFELKPDGSLDTSLVFNAKDRYRLRQSINERKNLCEIALGSCESQRRATLDLLDLVKAQIVE